MGWKSRAGRVEPVAAPPLPEVLAVHECASVVLAKRGSGRRHPPRVPLAALAS